MKIVIQVLLCVLIPGFLTARIIETSEFEELLSHVVSDKVLVVCDIDNTLLKSKGHFGGVAWGEYWIGQLTNQGLVTEEILKLESHIWRSVQHCIQVELIDPKTAEVLNEIKKRNSLVMALTARSPAEANFTHGQLESNGLNFAENHLPSQILNVGDREALYEKGILFATMLNKKSKVLFTFLDHHGIDPECIVFIDDKAHHVEEMMAACKGRGVKFIGIRFSGTDKHVESFDPLIADEEWKLIDDESVQKARTMLYSIFKKEC